MAYGNMCVHMCMCVSTCECVHLCKRYLKNVQLVSDHLPHLKRPGPTVQIVQLVGDLLSHLKIVQLVSDLLSSLALVQLLALKHRSIPLLKAKQVTARSTRRGREQLRVRAADPQWVIN